VDECKPLVGGDAGAEAGDGVHHAYCGAHCGDGLRRARALQGRALQLERARKGLKAVLKPPSVNACNNNVIDHYFQILLNPERLTPKP